MSIIDATAYYICFVAAIAFVAMAILLVSNDMRNCTANAEHSGERSEVRLLRSGYTTRQ